MRFSTYRLPAALLVALLLTAPVLAAPAPDRGPEDAVANSIVDGLWLGLTRLWDELVTYVGAADTTTGSPTGGTELNPTFDPDGFTALPPETGGDGGSSLVPLL